MRLGFEVHENPLAFKRVMCIGPKRLAANLSASGLSYL